MNKRQSKKDHILHAGLEIMMSQGYNGTSVKDIVDAAGVPKGSFYNYFHSKESFAVDALEAVSCESYLSSQALLSVDGKTPMQRLQHYFEQSSKQACEGEFRIGCFFGSMGQEMSDSNEAIRNKVKHVLNRNTQLFKAVLDEAQAAGEISQDASTETIAEFILNAWEGTLLRMKTSKSRESLDAFLKMLPQIAN
jgi:TetR/AcrR family transcriptional repressor of nem operon